MDAGAGVTTIDLKGRKDFETSFQSALAGGDDTYLSNIKINVQIRPLCLFLAFLCLLIGNVEIFFFLFNFSLIAKKTEIIFVSHEAFP